MSNRGPSNSVTKCESMIFRFVTGLRHMLWPGVSWRSGVLLAGVLLISVSCSGDNPSADKGSRADRVFVMADAGDSTAQTALGLLYERGIGIARDSAMALVWYRRAAAQGDALAEFHIGSLYERGAGVATDYAEAAKWYQLASDRGNESAQAALAYLYDRGLGVERDFAEAEALYGQASASWAEDDNYPADATFATGRESVVLASPTVISRPLGERRAEFVAGKEEEPAIEIDLAALNDVPLPPPPVTVFDGPEPIAGRGENFPLTTIALIQPEPTHVPEAHEPPGNVPLAAVDMDNGLRFLPTAPKPRLPTRAPPSENLPEVHLQSLEAAVAPTQGATERDSEKPSENHSENHEEKDRESDEGLLITAQPELERMVLSVEDLLNEEIAAPSSEDLPGVSEAVSEDARDAALKAALVADNAALDEPSAVTAEKPAAAHQTEAIADADAEAVAEAKAADDIMAQSENTVASLEAALDAEAAAFDAARESEKMDDLLIPLPPEPEIFLISLATFESEALALAAWEKISTTHAGLLRKLPFELQRLDLGDLSDLASSDDADADDGDGAVGQYVELIVGPVDSPLKSRTLCAVLRAHGHVCRTIEK